MRLHFKLKYVAWIVVLSFVFGAGNGMGAAGIEELTQGGWHPQPISSAPLVSFQKNSVKKQDSHRSVAQGNNSFCFDLYRHLQNEKGNIFFSPYSISTALAMTYAGAAGITEKEMAKTLHFTLSQEKLHPAFSKLAALLEKKENITLDIANALWIQQGFKLKTDFLNTTKQYYGAAPFQVDFKTSSNREKSRQKINRWVENKTNEKIKNLIPQGILSALTRLVLTNAIYFKGDWAVQFDEAKTKTKPFRVSPGKQVEAAMMYLKSHFKYKEGRGVQVLEMPYKGEEISMLVILPREDTGLEKVERELSENRLQEWTAGMRKREVDVYFPKFKMTCKYSMKDTLKAMGMGSAFSYKADFSAMAEEELLISEVLHKAFVEVNEEGTEAAAATAVVMEIRMSMPLVFKADRPFIFLIKDNGSGSILFMGRVYDPS